MATASAYPAGNLTGQYGIPKFLFITAFVEGIDYNSILCDCFGRDNLFNCDSKISVPMRGDQRFESIYLSEIKIKPVMKHIHRGNNLSG